MNSPVLDVTSTDIRCNVGAGTNGAATSTYTVTAGSTVRRLLSCTQRPARFTDHIYGKVGFQMDQGVLKSVTLCSPNNLLCFLHSYFPCWPPRCLSRYVVSSPTLLRILTSPPRQARHPPPPLPGTAVVQTGSRSTKLCVSKPSPISYHLLKHSNHSIRRAQSSPPLL